MLLFSTIIPGPRARLARRLQFLLDHDVSENTDKTRATQIKKYLEFCALYGVEPINPGYEGIAFYVAHLSNKYRYSSITGYLSGVNYYLKSHRGPPIVYTDPLVARAIRGARRVLGDTPVQALALMPEHLILMFQVLPVSPGHDCFWAAALFAFRTLLRKCHYTMSDSVLTREAFEFFDWGMMVTVRKTKTIQFKERKLLIPVCRVKNTMLCAVHWVEEHFNLIKGRPSHPAFLIPEGDSVVPLSYALFSDILELVTSRAGIVAERISSHGFRSGGSTYLARVGVELDVIKERGDWKSDQVLKYLRRPLEDRVILDERIAKLLSNMVCD